MPELNWIGKKAIINHHNEVPYKTLELQYTYKDGKKQTECDESENMIIHGDNLEALKSLLPKYEGKVNCIYIDPPYNTGEENWCYNDNVNAPQIQKWLGNIVGKETEDLTRHDKWLCMMYPRLKMLHKLMAKDGIIFISIDDNEQHRLRSLCDEIFGINHFVAQFIWEKRLNRENRTEVSTRHDYILAYSNIPSNSQNKRINQLPMNEKALANYKNPDNDPRGLWKSDPAHVQGGHGTTSQFYTLIAPNGKKHDLPSGRCWIYTEEIMREAINDNRIWFGLDGNGVPRIKTYLNSKERGLTPESMIFAKDGGTNENAKNFLKTMFEGNVVFETPKPHELIEYIIQIASSKDTIVLDSFAGAGTTAHAVLNMNKKDGGNRKFILIEMENYADTITAERVKRVIDGYPYKGTKEEEIYNQPLTIKNLAKASDFIDEADAIAESMKDEYDKISKPKIEDNCIKVIGTKVYDEKMEGLGGDFSFYELGCPLLDDNGFINEEQPIEKIQEYIWYTETHTAYNTEREAGESEYYLGKNNDVDYYFHYEKDRETFLDVDFLNNHIKHKVEKLVVYADTNLLNAEQMKRCNVIFKKIPRDIRKF